MGLTLSTVQGISLGQTFDVFQKLVARETRLGTRVINTFVQAIIYEPDNYTSCASNEADQPTVVTEAEYSYFDNTPPPLLSEYLWDMASLETSLDENGPTVLQCKGAGNHRHLFLSRTGYHRCHMCNVVVCLNCCDSIQEHTYCLQCYAAESLVPSRDGGYMERIASMRNELKERFKYDGADALTVDMVEEAYEAAQKSVRNHTDLFGSVKFPLYPTSELKDPTKWKAIHKIQFSEGGTFIGDPSLRGLVPALLSYDSCSYQRSCRICATSTNPSTAITPTLCSCSPFANSVRGALPLTTMIPYSPFFDRRRTSAES
jgi:hypothetical protein